MCAFVFLFLSSFIDWIIGFSMSQNTLDAKVEREIGLLQFLLIFSLLVKISVYNFAHSNL